MKNIIHFYEKYLELFDRKKFHLQKYLKNNII